MSNSVYYYVQECPTCGRGLRIRVAYLGRQVACQHCDARFTAVDPASVLEDISESNSSLLDRAAQLLETVERRHGVSG